MKDFRLEILSPHEPRKCDSLERAYATWAEVWGHVFRQEMGLEKDIYSDDFYRQEKIVALFHRDTCAGLAFMRGTDLSSPSRLQDSAFRYWPRETLERIREISSEVVLASYFTIHPNFRKSSEGLSIKTLFLHLFLEAFRLENPPIMVTAARKLRSNEKLCARLGSVTIASDLPFTLDRKTPVGAETVDILYWDKRRVFAEDLELSRLSREIWDEYMLNVTREVEDAA